MVIASSEVERVWMDPDLTRKKAAAELGVTVNLLTKRARRLGLPMREQIHKQADKVIVTDDEVRAIWERADLSREEQAHAVGINVASLRERAKKLALPMRRQVRDRRIPVELIRRAWLDPNLTGQQAADRVGLTRTNLQLRAKALGLPPRKAGQRYAITEPAQQLFVAMWDAPVKASDMAAYFDIHPQTVSAYARRMRLNRRTHPSRLMTLQQFWTHQMQVKFRDQLADVAKADKRAQTRYARQDFDADPAKPSPDSRPSKAQRKAVQTALKAKGLSMADIARDLSVRHQTVECVVAGRQRSKRVEVAISQALGQPLETIRAQAV